MRRALVILTAAILWPLDMAGRSIFWLLDSGIQFLSDVSRQIAKWNKPRN